MKRYVCLLMLVVALCALRPIASEAKVTIDRAAIIVDDARGVGESRDAALIAARTDALDKAMELCISGVTDLPQFESTRQNIHESASSLIKEIKIANEKKEKNGVVITAVCKIDRAKFDPILGKGVIAALGAPRIMILVDERVGDQQPFMSSVETAAIETFERAGYHVVDPDQARALLHIDPSSAYDDPAKLTEAARTLKADIVIVGRAYASPYAEQKVHGVTLFGVKGTVQFKAVLAQSAYQIGTKTFEETTGKKPATSVEEGAMRCFKGAASRAADEIVFEIAYKMASANTSVGGRTIGVKIADASFKDAQTIEDSLRAHSGGEVFRRAYRDRELELDVVSEMSADDLASFLSDQRIIISTVTAQSVAGSLSSPASAASNMPLPSATVTVILSGVQSYDEGKIIEGAIAQMISSMGSVSGAFDGGARAMKISIAFMDEAKSANDLAQFLGRADASALDPDLAELIEHRVHGIKITDVADDLVVCEVQRGIF